MAHRMDILSPLLALESGIMSHLRVDVFESEEEHSGYVKEDKFLRHQRLRHRRLRKLRKDSYIMGM